MKYLKEKGLRAPADYGIVGFDNVDTLKYITPQLVTVSNKVDCSRKGGSADAVCADRCGAGAGR